MGMPVKVGFGAARLDVFVGQALDVLDKTLQVVGCILGIVVLPVFLIIGLWGIGLAVGLLFRCLGGIEAAVDG